MPIDNKPSLTGFGEILVPTLPLPPGPATAASRSIGPGPVFPEPGTRRAPRKPELDALRGLFLVWMTLTHLPTRLSNFVNQPFGFVSSAEGFVFLSALLVSRIYITDAADHYTTLRSKLWRRALRVYTYHAVLLLLAFTGGAAFAVYAHRIALHNLLNFYIAHTPTALVGSLLLLYCPPLLDILPMYVLFLLASPLLLRAAVRRGWTPVLLASLGIWLTAQFGLRVTIYSALLHLIHLPIPRGEWGAFDLFAWQWIWISGMWLGARSAGGAVPLGKAPGWLIALSAAVCLLFIGVRHSWLGPELTPVHFGVALDKWQIGPLRMVNLAAFAITFYFLRRPVRWLIAREPFLTLGQASLEVFCAHLFFVFAALSLLSGDALQLHGFVAVAVVVVTFAGLIGIAAREVRKKQTLRRATSRHAEYQTTHS